MKLIIDIPEEIVTAIQNGQDYRYDIHTAIAQGIEVSTDDDLISREALKKHIAEIVETEEKIDKKWAMGLKYSLKIIDNTPTVDTYTIEDVRDLIGLLEKRPTGKWIKKVDDVGFISHICSNCGADMQGDDNG